MKILKWLDNNILLILTIFLLVFIPLYPKLPLVGVNHTWIYVRLEDFFVTVSLLILLIQVIRKKASIRTPLTLPIILFWIIGAISTFYAINFMFPHLANVFPNVSLLYMLRHIEYLSVFFLAYSAINNKKRLTLIVAAFTITLLAVCLYGYGQRGFLVGFEHRFPAFSTMNEEFAKGEPLYISAENRIQSTFAGHYDLAAYLILLIPLMGSLVIGVKRWWGKLIFFACWIAGLILLLMTASRVSFAVYLVGITFMLILQRQKKFIIPVIVISILIMMSFAGISSRFAQTITTQDIVVDQKLHKVIGLATSENGKITVKENEQNNGEELPPSSSSFINIPNESQEQTKTVVQIERKRLINGKQTTEITNVEGDYVLKKALALDLSFTTRFQGEWPRAIDALKRNLLLGSGYSSINAATDNNYLRMLGETGILGIVSFIFIFIILSIYVYNVIPDVEPQYSRSFIIGGLAGILGLSLNGILIDVFEASKVAFVLWLLTGVMLGLLHQYQKRKVVYLHDLKKLFVSAPAFILYFFSASLAVFYPTLNNYFVADDFTWLRWIADCNKVLYKSGFMACEPAKATLIQFFTDAQGFFYRPGAKLYFYALYAVAWLNPFAYHVVSLLVHFAVTTLTFLISLKLLKNKLFAFFTAIIFLTLSVHSEAVLWISSVGHMLASFFVLLGLLLHIYWREKKKTVYLITVILSILMAPLFQETGIIAAPLIIFIDIFVLQAHPWKKILTRWYYALYLLPVPFYMILRYYANSIWSGGDYSYNLLKLPYNILGNMLGYIGVVLAGPAFLPLYSQIRAFGRTNMPIVAGSFIILLLLTFLFYKYILLKLNTDERKIIYASVLLFFVPLIPVLGLGNIALRYSYLGSFGVILFATFFLYKFYKLLAIKSLRITLLVTFILVTLFSTYQVKALYRSNRDWNHAGQITNNLLLDMNYTFPGQKATPPNPVFYFVNVPIKTGDAWIFPVGLNDALWFTFQNANLTVHTAKNVNIALDEAEGSGSARVFEFDNKGNAAEVTRTKIIIPVVK
jgi:hypothetical protein